jgi:hypothetical protein
MNLTGAILLDLTLKGALKTYGEQGTAGQVLTAQGGNVPPRWTDTSATSTNLTFTGASTPFTLNSSSGTGVTLAAGSGVTLSRSGNELTIASSGGFTLPALTSGSVLFSNGTTIAQDNAAFFWDDSNNRLGLGLTTPAVRLHVEDALDGASLELFRLRNSGITSPGAYMTFYGGATESARIEGRASTLRFSTGSSGTERMRIDSTGQVGIDTTSPTSKLDITTASLGVSQTTSSGLALVNTTAATVGAQQMSPGLRWSGNGWQTNATAASQTVDFLADVLPVQGAANPTGTWQLKSSVGGGAYIPQISVNNSTGVAISGTGARILRFQSNSGANNDLICTMDDNGLILSSAILGTIANFRTNSNNITFAQPVSLTNTFNSDYTQSATSGTYNVIGYTGTIAPTSGTSIINSINIAPTINQTGGANGIMRGLYINPTLTAAADFRAIEISNNSGRGIYQTGASATNYFAGSTGIGTTSPDRLLHPELSDATTNTVTYPMRISKVTSGTATTGFGLGTEYELENASGTNRVAATQEITYSDAADATEDATYTLKLIRAGALTDAVSVSSVGALTAQGGVSIPATNYLKFTSASTLSSAIDGNFTLFNAARTDFNRLQFGGTTSSFPSLQRSGTGLIVRLADDSNNAPFTASLLTSTGGVVTLGSAGTLLTNSSNGILMVSNNAGNDFSRLQFGGTTALFPSLKRSGAALISRLADDSAHANFECAQINTTGSIVANGGSNISWNARSAMGSAVNGDIKLSNAAGNDFNLLTFGGATSSYPALKRSSATLVVRLADDSGDATITAGNVISTGIVRTRSYTVATLPAGTQGDMAYVTDATAPTYLGALTGGGAVVCPVFYNGTIWVSH